MKIEYEAYRLFVDYCRGKLSFEALMQHRAYQNVLKHGEYYSNGTSSQRLLEALTEKDKPFYGFRHKESYSETISQTDALIRFIKENQAY